MNKKQQYCIIYVYYVLCQSIVVVVALTCIVRIRHARTLSL